MAPNSQDPDQQAWMWKQIKWWPYVTLATQIHNFCFTPTHANSFPARLSLTSLRPKQSDVRVGHVPLFDCEPISITEQAFSTKCTRQRRTCLTSHLNEAWCVVPWKSNCAASSSSTTLYSPAPCGWCGSLALHMYSANAFPGCSSPTSQAI